MLPIGELCILHSIWCSVSIAYGTKCCIYRNPPHHYRIGFGCSAFTERDPFGSNSFTLAAHASVDHVLRRR